MSDVDQTPAGKQTPEEIQADIQATRDRLAANVDALSDKLDVKAHAEGVVSDAKASVSSAAESVAAESRTLVAKFRALPLSVQAGIAAGAVAVLVTVVVRSARA